MTIHSALMVFDYSVLAIAVAGFAAVIAAALLDARAAKARHAGPDRVPMRRPQPYDARHARNRDFARHAWGSDDPGAEVPPCRVSPAVAYALSRTEES